MSHVCTEENEKRSMSGEAANGMADVSQYIYILFTQKRTSIAVSSFSYIYLQKSTKITFLLKGGI